MFISLHLKTIGKLTISDRIPALTINILMFEFFPLYIQGWYKIIVFSVGISWYSLHHDILTENTILLYHPCIVLMFEFFPLQGWYKIIVFSVGISWCSLHHDIPTENTIILYHLYMQGEKFKHKDINGQCRDNRIKLSQLPTFPKSIPGHPKVMNCSNVQ